MFFVNICGSNSTIINEPIMKFKIKKLYTIGFSNYGRFA
jgi:hypothetical protein